MIKVKNYREMSSVASGIVINEVLNKPDAVIGFATGRTVKGLYKNLVKKFRRGEVDFSKVVGFGIDEYYPIGKDDKRSFRRYLFGKLFGKVNFRKSNLNFLDGSVKDWKKECLRYERKIKKSPIDLLILGVGVNGHIGFNEPGSLKSSRTRLIKLSEETIERNFGRKKGFSEALTMGVGTILSARKILVLASGREKAWAIGRLLKGKVGSDCPISFLREHKDLVVVGRETASPKEMKKFL